MKRLLTDNHHVTECTGPIQPATGRRAIRLRDQANHPHRMQQPGATVLMRRERKELCMGLDLCEEEGSINSVKNLTEEQLNNLESNMIRSVRAVQKGLEETFLEYDRMFRPDDHYSPKPKTTPNS